MEPLIKMTKINKEFPGVKALQDVDFELLPGEIHALLGENGAGKSTLIKIISGAYAKNSGKFLYKGKEVDFTEPIQAQNLGISTIYQELSLMSNMDIGRNIFLGRESTSRKTQILDKRQIYTESAKFLRKVGLKVSPRTKIKDLSVAQRQLVEIAKAISFKTEVLIMDEPTSSLSKEETENLFKIIEKLKESGVGIIYISHKMDEIKRIADRVTVFRDGQKIGTLTKEEIDSDVILKMMVGRELKITKKRSRKTNYENILLEVKNLNKTGVVNNINFKLYEGEILGFAGLVGAGRTELARMIFGADSFDNGKIYIKGKAVNIKSPEEAIKQGIGLVPEDRKDQGLMLNMNVEQNITITSLKAMSNGNIIDKKAQRTQAQKTVNTLKVKTPSLLQKIKFLSGGNQQKGILGRWLLTNPKILILDEPTRGIDIGAKTEIYNIMIDLAESGVGIIMISSELPEIINVSDRVIVMHEGDITANLTGDDINQETIMKYALGGKLKSAKC